MAEHEHTLAERLAIQARRSADAIAANDAAEQSPTPKKKKKKKKAKKKEAIGTGTPSFDLAGAISKIDGLMALTEDPAMLAKLQARKDALAANAL